MNPRFTTPIFSWITEISYPQLRRLRSFKLLFRVRHSALLKQFSPKPHVARGPHPITCPHLTTAFCNVLHSDYKDSNCGDKLSGITFGYYFLLLSGSGVQDASRPRAGPSPPDAINKSKRF